MATGNDIMKGKTPLQRADLALSDLASGGKLSDEVYAEWIKLVQNATPLLAAARRVDMGSHTTKIPKIVFAGRILGADPGEGTEVPSGSRVKPTTSEVSLVSKVVAGSVKVPYEVFEDNVSKEGLEQLLMQLIAERVGVDLEELFLCGDTAVVGSDPFLGTLNGWLKLVTTNVVNASNAYVSKALLEQLAGTVALRFRQRGGFSYFVEDHAGEKWRSLVGERSTPTGDKYTVESEQLPPCAGRPMIAVGNMPVASGSPDTSKILLANPKSLIWGVWREVKIRTWDEPRERAVYILVDARVACAVEHEAACAKMTNVRATA